MRKKYLVHPDWPSVTKILDVLRKIGLENWYKSNTLAYINRTSKKGKKIGKTLHEAIQGHVESSRMSIKTEYPTEVKNTIRSFFLFKKRNPQFVLKRAEIQVFSGRYKFNGTLDCHAREKNCIIIFDWSTGECKEEKKPRIYNEKKYQLAAYIKAYNELFKTNIKKGYVVVFAKDKVAYNMCCIKGKEIDELFHEVFLSALKILNYQKAQEKKEYLLQEKIKKSKKKPKKKRKKSKGRG